jgi:hypothetical protein
MTRLANRAVTPKQSAVLERLKARTVAAGSFSGVCLPALGEHYFERNLVSDESCIAYEKAHLPLGAWPPTTWYANWASGHNLFAQSAGHAPIELRWLEYRRNT